jgi:hypothetical protein
MAPMSPGAGVTGRRWAGARGRSAARPGLGPAAAGLAAATAACVAACGGGTPTGPGGSLSRADLLVLNSTGQTLSAWSVVGDALSAAGGTVDLGAGFDGDALATSGERAASTVSSYGGSRIVLVDLAFGTVSTASFPDPEGALANPSRPSFDAGGTLWVGGRGSDAVYRLDPGAATATRVASGVGSFVESVVPFGFELFAIDANLDDDGMTYLPRGPGRVVVLGRDGVERDVLVLPASARNPSGAVIAAGRIAILAGGTFDPATFAPRADGALLLLEPGSRALGTPIPLGANGIGIEAGADGLVYVTTTRDFASIEILRFDPLLGSFERGPDDPVRPRGADGDPVDCWSATGLSDGRIVCVTFRSDAPGLLLLADAEGKALDEAPSGFGSTDVALR